MYCSCYPTHIMQPYLSNTFPVRISFVTDQEGAEGAINGHISVYVLGRKLETPSFTYYYYEKPAETLPNGNLRYYFSEDKLPIREIAVPENLPGESLPIEVYLEPLEKLFTEPTQTPYTTPLYKSIPLFKDGKRVTAIRITYLNNVLGSSVSYV